MNRFVYGWLAVAVAVGLGTGAWAGCDGGDGPEMDTFPGTGGPLGNPDDNPSGPGLEPPNSGMGSGGAAGNGATQNPAVMPPATTPRNGANPAGGASPDGSQAPPGEPVADPTDPPSDAAPGGLGADGDTGTDMAGDMDAGVPMDSGMPDADMAANTDLGPGTRPIDAPVADDCITDVSAGDHTFTCGSVTFLVIVSEQCTRFACGLIFDVHGATMGGAQMRDNTLLHEQAPERGYIVVHPSAGPGNTGNTWDQASQAPDVADFMQRMIAAFHVDSRRVHFTGFSQGSGMAFYFLCNHNDLLASVAPVSGAGGTSECLDTDWSPKVPMLYMNGVGDTASTIERSREMIDGVVTRMALTGGDEIDSGAGYTRVRYEGADGMELEYIEHDYGGQAVLAGHCIPGGVDTPGAANNFILNATTCTTGPEPRLPWGEVVLQWFIDHPRP